MAEADGRGGVRGALVVLALAAFGALFVWLLYGLTRGRMRARVPEAPPGAGERR